MGPAQQAFQEQTVKVYLRDGRVLKGAVHQFGPDGLGFVGPENITQVKRGDITHTTGLIRKEEVLELTLRDGRVLNGTVQGESEEMVGLLEPQNIVQLKRADVRRVTTRGRLLAAGIGALALGGAFGIANAGSKEGTPAVRAFGTCAMAAVGAAIGAAIGHTSTIYEAERRK